MTAQPEQFVIDQRGRKTGVVLSIRAYRRLMEDLHDLAEIAERRDEATIDADEMRRRLRADGILPADL